MTTTTVDLTTVSSKNQRGNLLKLKLAEVLRSLGFTVEIEKGYVIETWGCTLCFLCSKVCPVECIKLVEPENHTK